MAIRKVAKWVLYIEGICFLPINVGELVLHWVVLYSAKDVE